MRISVLIVSFNVRERLAECLASIRGAADGADVADVIVVDNASHDGSAQWVAAHFPEVRLVARTTNGGFSVAVNEAARLARGDAFLLLNPDTRLYAGDLARMGAALQSHRGALAIGFRQVDAAGGFQLSFGWQPTLGGELLRCSVQRGLDAGSPRLARLIDWGMSRPRVVPWVAGSSLLVWRHAFERVGGFDERFFLYFEDIDFCLRLEQLGGRVVYDPSVTLLHHRGVSAAQNPGLAARAYRRSQLAFWEKHRGPWMRRLIHGYLWARGLSSPVATT